MLVLYVETTSINARSGNAAVDSAKQNLASTFVNAFVNAGFGKDPLMTPEGSDWMYKNKVGLTSSVKAIPDILPGPRYDECYRVSRSDFIMGP